MITLVKNVRQLVTSLGSDPAAGPRMGEVLVREGVRLVLEGERIAAVEVGCGETRADRVIDAADGIVVPGLVDPCVTAVRGERNRPDPSDPDAGLSRLRAGAEALLRHGTTSVEIRAARHDAGSGPEEILADLHQLAHRVPMRISCSLLGAPDPGADSGSADRISRLIGETIPSVSRRQLAATCVVLCGDGGYRRKEACAVLRAARGAGLRLKIQAVGGDGEALLAASDIPVEAIDHLTGSSFSTRSLATLRKAGTIPILLPSAHLADRDAPASAGLLLGAGLPVALGSAADVVGGGVLSLWTGIALAVRHLNLSLEQALVAATLNAAAAIGLADQVGTLEPGKLADFAILDLDDYRRIPDFVVGLPIRTVVARGREWGR